MPNVYVRTRAAAAYLGLGERGVRYLEQLRSTGGGPRYYRPPGRRIIVYKVSVLDSWLAAGVRDRTSHGIPPTFNATSTA